VTTTEEITLDGDNFVMIPTAGLPPGTVISIQITIGASDPKAAEKAVQPEKPRHMGMSRSINGRER
jgi:hypothetical protein